MSDGTFGSLKTFNPPERDRLMSFLEELELEVVSFNGPELKVNGSSESLDLIQKLWPMLSESWVHTRNTQEKKTKRFRIDTEHKFTKALFKAFSVINLDVDIMSKTKLDITSVKRGLKIAADWLDICAGWIKDDAEEVDWVKALLTQREN